MLLLGTDSGIGRADLATIGFGQAADPMDTLRETVLVGKEKETFLVAFALVMAWEDLDFVFVDFSPLLEAVLLSCSLRA